MSTTKKRQAEDNPAQPKPKKSKKRKANAPDDELLDTELGLNTLFTKMDNQLLADHLAQKLGRFGTDLSAVEISDMTVSANAIQDTTSWQESRTLDKFPDFLEKVSEDPEGLKKAPKKTGSPHTLIVAGAGLRAADIVRSMRKFQSKENSVAKLFAKHMKVEEQVKFLQKHKTGICVGTPARLMDLIDNGEFGLDPSLSRLPQNHRQALTSAGALSLENLKRLVVDASHIDQKKRGLMDMKETMMPLARFLSRKELKDRYGDEKKPLALLFY
ncbi:protein cms1 [Fusarium bulbicola]|nr:protein cms1 [Fusarium bulbicola]